MAKYIHEKWKWSKVFAVYTYSNGTKPAPGIIVSQTIACISVSNNNFICVVVAIYSDWIKMHDIQWNVLKMDMKEKQGHGWLWLNQYNGQEPPQL